MSMPMGGMVAAAWSLGGAVLFVALWTVMMAAMMLPAAAPMIVIFASAQGRRAAPAIGVALIVLGLMVAIGAVPMPWIA